MSLLFSPLTLRGTTLRNRVWVAPLLRDPHWPLRAAAVGADVAWPDQYARAAPFPPG